MRFSKFSNEIKLDIFAKFTVKELCNKVSPVCREWRQYAFTPILWTTVTLDGRNRSEYQMTQILNRCSRLRKLSIYYVENFSWLKKCPVIKSVRRIGINYSNTSSETLSQLVSLYPYAEVFIVRSSFYASDVIAKEMIQWNYLKLIFLQLENGDCSKCLDLISSNCHNLCKFFAIGFRDINDSSFTNFINQRGPQLQLLRIEGLTNISSDVYRLIPQKCRRLEELSLSQSKNLTDVGFLSLWKSSNLNCLSIEGSEKLFSSAFSDLCLADVNSSSIDNVEFIRCDHLNKDDLNIFVNCYGQKLRELSISPTNTLTLADCQNIAQEYGFQSGCIVLGNAVYRIQLVRQ